MSFSLDINAIVVIERQEGRHLHSAIIVLRQRGLRRHFRQVESKIKDTGLKMSLVFGRKFTSSTVVVVLPGIGDK